ncbi:protein C19orf12-like [Indicator indicator]|uniref:protein C19orf12-like n=1 Tax=Indicator indicator TaxID=1002788 RepID=UPI0023DF9B35|nr:protein C19orf12-like [Indicator indicator]
MPIDVCDVMALFLHLAKAKGMKAAAIRSGQGALVASASTFAGGLLAGPVGLAVGGALGGILGGWMTAGQFKPVPQILMELPPSEQQKLYDEAVVILRNLDWMDVAQLTALVMGNANLQQKLTELLINYFSKELNVKMKYSK